MVHHDHAASGRVPLLQPGDRWRRHRGSGDTDVLRLGLVQQRHRGARAHGRRRLLRPEGRAAGDGATAVVLVEGDGDLASRLRLHAAGLRHQREDEISGVVPAARVGRERARLARARARRRHHGQPDRGEKGQAHDHRHGQPERGEAGRERVPLRRARIDHAGRSPASATGGRSAGGPSRRSRARRPRLTGGPFSRR